MVCGLWFMVKALVPALWVVRVGGDDGELRPWHSIYEGRKGRWGIPTMALRPWRYIHEGRRRRWGTPSMALHIRSAMVASFPSSPPPLTTHRHYALLLWTWGSGLSYRV